MAAKPLFLPSAQPQTLTAETPADSPEQVMADLELERHIASCGDLMLAAYARYEISSDLQDRGEADRWRLEQAEAVKARRPGFVAGLELARGLS